MTRFWEPRLGAWQVQVMPGELYVSRDDEVITTVLGSCVSACVRDTGRGLGGMNHFLLPRAPRADTTPSARYGVYALELLLDAVLRAGGSRADLEVKVFGGGRVMDPGGDVGRDNIAFAHRFFSDTRLAVSVADVGGTIARRLRYWPRTGRVQVMHLPMAAIANIVAEEADAAASFRGGEEVF